MKGLGYMNYLKEINAFHIWQETNPLTASAAHLWSVLMHVNNRTRWKKEFTVAASVLCVKSALSESTFRRARKELSDKGYIHYKSQGANRAAVYQMISLVSFEEEDGDSAADGVAGIVDDSMKHSVNDTSVGSVGTLYKQDLTKQNENIATTTAADAVVFYQENFGMISPFISESLLGWVDYVGEPLVLAAMKRALERGKMNWGYVKAILLDWRKKGVRTVEAAQAADVEFQKQRGMRSGRSGGSVQKEVVPEWFAERERELKKETKENQAGSVLSKEEEEAELEELRKLLGGEEDAG